VAGEDAKLFIKPANSVTKSGLVVAFVLATALGGLALARPNFAASVWRASAGLVGNKISVSRIPHLAPTARTVSSAVLEPPMFVGGLLNWNTFGNVGTETTEPSTTNDPNVSAANLTLGAGVTASANANRFGGNDWFDVGDTNPTTLAESIAGNDYIQFIVTPNAGFSFTPTSLVFSFDHSATGPGSLTLRSSADSFATDLGSVTGLAASITTNTITISGLTNLTTATTFRLYGYGATAAAGTGGFDVASNVDNVVLNGTTAAIPPKYRSRQSGNWNDFNTWEIDTGGGFVNAIAGQTPTSADDTIQIRNTHTVTVTAAVSIDQTTVDSGGQITLSGANLTVDNGTGTDLTINGTFTADTNQILASAAGVSIAINGRLKTANTNGFIGSSSTTISSTNSPTVTLATSSTIEYNGSGSQTISATNYGNLESSNTGDRDLASTGTIGVATSFIPGSNNYTNTGSTVDFNGAFQTIIPAFNYNNLTSSNSGGRTLVNGFGQIAVAGVFTPGINVYNPSTSTFEYNGTSAQSMPSTRGFTYYELSIRNAAGVTAPDTGQTVVVNNALFLINGPLTLATTSSLHLANNSTIDRSDGSISAAPTFDGVVNVSYTGTSLTTTGPEIPTSNTVLNNLTMNDAAGVTLNADAQVNNQLIFTSGILFSGDKILTLGGSASSTGAGAGKYVDGFLSKISPPDPFTFDVGNGGYSTIVIDTLVGSDTVTVRAFGVYHPLIANTATALKRYWQLTKGAGLTSAFITFNYLDGDVGTSNESIYTAYKFAGSATIVPVVPDAANNKARTVSPQTSFSSWTLAEPATPTAVRFTSLKAASYADGVELNWESGFELNNLGYHVYREQNGRRTRVTPSIVAGSALTVGVGKKLTAGYSYSWFDPQGTPNSAYSLEAIDLDGNSAWAGPVYPNAGRYSGPGRKALKREQAMLLIEIAGDGRDQTGVSSWPAMSSTTLTPLSSAEKSGLELSQSQRRQAGVPGAAAAQGWRVGENESAVEPAHSKQQVIAGGKAVKIQVRKSGWYRVTQAELVAAGFDPSTDARLLQMYVDGQEVPISLSTDSAQLGAADTLEFYGVGLETPTTDKRVYWLVSGSSPGLRMVTRRGKLKAAEPNTEIVSGSFDLTVERRDRLVYFSGLLNGEAENIFGASVRADWVNQTLVLKNVDRDSGSQPRVEVALQGLTTGTHIVQLQVNGSSVGTMTFANTEHPVAKFAVNAGLLREGDNVVSLASMNGQSDVSLLDWVRLTYPRQYRAENNSLAFSALGGQLLKLEGFSSAGIRVVDITDANSPVQLPAYATKAGSGYNLTLQPVGAGVRSLIAFMEEQVGHPVSITANQPSSWNAGTNGADMLIITHQDFRQALEPLASLRRSQGLSVAVVDVEDVYDEFSYGAHTPAAIKSFLTTAVGSWSRKPQYLLLVGDSSWDPRNYMNKGENDFVPTKLIDTQGMETGSDDWLADFNNVGLANLAVGRLPVRTAAEASLIVSKILTYEQERELKEPLRGALMVADQGFEPQSSQTRALLPENVTVQTINRAEVGNDEMMRGQIVEALNQGPMMVNYYGHGSVRVWTGAGLLNSDLAGGLTNANRLSVYVMMTCLNGYASDATIDSLGEAALKAPNGGAVAVWASSGFTTPQPQFEMNSEFYRLLFTGQPMRLGDAVRNAKAATADLDVRRTWILLGDPAMRVR
jgi:peptidase C25-like protein